MIRSAAMLLCAYTALRFRLMRGKAAFLFLVMWSKVCVRGQELSVNELN